MRKLLLLLMLLAVGALGALAQTDVTASYIGDVTLIVNGGGHTHGSQNHAESAGRGWWNNQTLLSGWHAFAAPDANGAAGESWQSGFGSAGVMMGRTMVLPEGNYTLSFEACGMNAANSDDSDATPVSGDAVGFLTGQPDVDITNSAPGDNTFHTVSFTFDVTTANTSYEFGIKKVSDESKIDWCQIKNIKLVLNSTNITPVDNSSISGFTYSGSQTWHTNTWSVEGQSDGTRFQVPFHELWVASGGTLSDATITGSYTPTANGVYKVSAWVRAMNEAGGDISGVKIFVGDAEADACTGSSARDGKARIGTFSAMADGVSGTPFYYGFKLENATLNWLSFKNVTITYYPEMPDAEKNALLGLVPTGKMSASVKNTLDGYVTAFESNASVANYNALSLYIPTAVSSVAVYTAINTAISNYATKAAALDAAGQAAYDASGIQAKYDNGTYEKLADAESELATAFATAVKAQTTVGSDWTELIVNPSFESDINNGWTSNMARQGNTEFGKTGTYYAEKYEPVGSFGVTQTITGMPAGVYRMSAHVKARGVTSAKLYAAGIEQAIKVEDKEDDYSVEFACDANADITIGFEGVGTDPKTDASWLCVDNFTLTLVSAGLPDVVAVEGKMNAEVAQQQTDAISTYNADKTVANYNVASVAIAAAQTSKDAYLAASTAITKAENLQTANNFVTSEAATTFAEAIAAIKTDYENGALIDENAYNAGKNLGVVAVGWHASATNTPASNYIGSTWSSTDFVINDWSVEGENDGSNFTVPFIQYWTNDGNSLVENTWTGTMTGLNNGLYSVQALVRVRAKNETAVADATGITMDVNGATAVDVTEGTQVGESQFQLATYTAVGLVKDGNLNLHFNIAEENNISWLSFKNIKYTKVRDLTAEEEATAPTAITLYNGGTEVTSPIALDKNTTTVTLTPSYTPVNATEGYITWLSSDPSVVTVVDGVVTAITSGTATITVTSTLDTNVTASATITVAFPESTVPAYENEGATRKIHNYGDNLIKNGSFDYTDGFYGWLNGAGSKLGTNSGFTLVEEDGENVLRAVNGSNSDNGGGTVKSIKTGWPIESGKTYVFGYRVKSSGTAEFHVVSMTNTIGTETAPLNTQNERKAIKYNGSWTEQSYEFTNSGGYKYVQFAARWLSNSDYFDDFYLVEKTAADGIEGNVDYAKDAIPTTNIGTGAFQYSQDAIDAANALVQGTATVEDVENAYAAVTTLNVPDATQAYNLVFNSEGHTKTGNSLTLVPNPKQTQGLYGLQYLEKANVNLAQAFYFTHTTGNKYKVHAIDTDGNARYITTQAEGYGTTWYEGIRTITDATKAMEIEIRPNGEGKYILWNTGANKAIAHNGNNIIDFFTNNTADFEFVPTTKPSITINTTAAGWGTTILPFAVASLPAGVKAYSCSEVDGNSLILVEVDALEANKPYLIEGTWNEILTGDAQGTKLTYTEGLFTGVYASQAAPVGTYVLQKIKDKVAFYVVGDGNQPMVGANRVYMTEPSNVKSVYYFDGEDNIATGINAIDALINGDAEIFNAAGVKMPTLQKGLNIIRTNDGKTQKVFVK